MYYGASGASRGRYLGAKHYERLEAQVEAATAKAKASGLRKDMARRSKLVKRLRRQGWHPPEHAAVLEQLRALSLDNNRHHSSLRTHLPTTRLIVV